MLKITVEILPFGDEKLKRVIGTGYIINDGTGHSDFGNYNCKFKTEDNKQIKETYLKNFKRSKGFWKLIGEVLK